MSRTQIEKKIQTIEGLRDIISSMRSLAAIYLGQAEERLEGVRTYADTVGRAIEDCLFGRYIALPQDRDTGNLILAFFSEQGLCGRFNEVVAEAASDFAGTVNSPAFIAVGRRGPPLLRRAELEAVAELSSTSSPSGQDTVIHSIARTVLELLSGNRFGSLHLLYARYLSPGRIQPQIERILPLDLDQWRNTKDPHETQPHLALPRRQLLSQLVSEYTFASLYRAMTESLAAENGMRLQSMEAAKNNIDETMEELQVQVRIQRQNEITEELLDLVSGSEALKHV